MCGHSVDKMWTFQRCGHLELGIHAVDSNFSHLKCSWVFLVCGVMVCLFSSSVKMKIILFSSWGILLLIKYDGKCERLAGNRVLDP